MNASSSLDSKKRGFNDSLSAFELFFQYNQNKLAAQTSSVGAVPSEEPSLSGVFDHPSTHTSFRHRREIYKRYVQRFLNEAPGHVFPSANMLLFSREHTADMWKMADESTRSVFIELAREAQDAAEQHRPPRKKSFHMDDASLAHCPIVHARKKSLHIDDASLAYCPIVHSPKGSNRNMPTSFFQEVPPIPSGQPNQCQSNSLGVRVPNPNPSQDAGAEHPKYAQLTGIVSLINEKDDIDSDEMRRFLGELDWS